MICSKCKIDKPNNEFYKHKTNLSGYRSDCKECTPKKTYRQSRTSQLKHHYNITLEQYQLLFKQQRGRCAICRNTSKRFLDVDHSHITNKVRGLLCNRCNKTIGAFEDNIRLFKFAIKYLSSTEQL